MSSSDIDGENEEEYLEAGRKNYHETSMQINDEASSSNIDEIAVGGSSSSSSSSTSLSSSSDISSYEKIKKTIKNCLAVNELTTIVNFRSLNQVQRNTIFLMILNKVSSLHFRIYSFNSFKENILCVQKYSGN